MNIQLVKDGSMPRNKAINVQMREESRTKILETAGKLFAQYGFYSIRIAQIAKEAEMSTGNIYWYFSSKEDILKALLENFFLGMEQVLVQAKTGPGDGLAKLNYLVDLEMAFMREHSNDFQIFMSVLGHGGNAFMTKLGFNTPQIGASYHQHLASILKETVQEGSIPEQNIDLLAMSFFAFFNGLLITYGQDWQLFPEPFIRQNVMRLVGRC